MSAEESVKDAIIERIRAITEQKGMSGAELARRSGLDRHALYRIRSGRSVTFDQVWAIARGLDVSPLELLPVEAAHGSDYSDNERALIEAIRGGDPMTIRLAIAELLPAGTATSVMGGRALPPLDRDELVQAIAQATAGLSRIADLARERADAEGDVQK